MLQHVGQASGQFLVYRTRHPHNSSLVEVNDSYGSVTIVSPASTVIIHKVVYREGDVCKPFIPLNCGAIPTELMENEFFGHVQGAFTGAATAQPGLIGVADSGTLFLDDIDCLSTSS